MTILPVSKIKESNNTDLQDEIVNEHERDPLRMIILGPGGTGKSMLISAITETFEHYGKEDILTKCATTGIAASDIGGKTVHS